MGDRKAIYPVIDRNPSFSKCLQHCTRFEYLTIMGSVLSSVVSLGANIRTGTNPAYKTLALCTAGATMGHLFNSAVNNSSERLRGLSPNHDLIARLKETEMEKINKINKINSTKPWYPYVYKATSTSVTLTLSTCFALVAANIDHSGVKPGFRMNGLLTAGLAFGFAYAYLDSLFHFMCYSHNNDDEGNTEYTVIDPKPDSSKVVGNFNKMDYVRIPASTAFCIFGGHHLGQRIPPALRGQLMLGSGLFGLMNGSWYSYLDSAGRLKGVFPNDDEVARLKKK